MTSKLRRELTRGTQVLSDPDRHPFKAHPAHPLTCDSCGLPKAAHSRVNVAPGPAKPAHRDNLPPLHVPVAPAVVLTNYPAPVVKLDAESWFRFFLTPDVYIDVNVVREGERYVLDLHGAGALLVRPLVSNVIHVEVA